MTIKYIITTTSNFRIEDSLTGINSWPTRESADEALAELDTRGELDPDTYLVAATNIEETSV